MDSEIKLQKCIDNHWIFIDSEIKVQTCNANQRSLIDSEIKVQKCNENQWTLIDSEIEVQKCNKKHSNLIDSEIKLQRLIPRLRFKNAMKIDEIWLIPRLRKTPLLRAQRPPSKALSETDNGSLESTISLMRPNLSPILACLFTERGHLRWHSRLLLASRCSVAPPPPKAAGAWQAIGAYSVLGDPPSIPLNRLETRSSSSWTLSPRLSLSGRLGESLDRGSTTCLPCFYYVCITTFYYVATTIFPKIIILGQLNIGRDGCGRDTLENRPKNLFETFARLCTTSLYHFAVPLRRTTLGTFKNAIKTNGIW